MQEAALNWEVNDEEELIRWPGEERVPFQTERHMLSHGGTRKNGVLGKPQAVSHGWSRRAGWAVPGGEGQGAREKQ